MQQFIDVFNLIVFLVFSIMYAYQVIYTIVGFIYRKPVHNDAPPKAFHRFGIIIAARNESAVIGELLRSIANQNYPKDALDVFVIADNCTDNTAEIAREHGAFAYERNDTSAIGKGWALDFLFKKMIAEGRFDDYEGFCVLDADNLLDENFIAEMNKMFDQGHRILTSYRNSKNYGANWISAGYGLWFMREARYLNNPRMRLGASCAISGTGFLVHHDIIAKHDGWKHHLLTEDIEFTIDSVIDGEKVGYCEHAVLYDEQPTTMQQSWVQRLRWSKGFYQVISHYGGRLWRNIFHGKGKVLSCFDMFMTVAPAYLVTVLTLTINLVVFIVAAITHMGAGLMWATGSAVVSALASFYGVFLFMGTLTLITEWRNIKCPARKKIGYMFLFPCFLFTYVPISVVALFKKVSWQPVEHTDVKTLDEVR
ncbi:MAG: glycosyltransferase family 2 protein [Clostridia bacterium]|nr:glycosyltransferase family 2 protein [Clostridia bacterium]